jgi:hypothetical protein
MNDRERSTPGLRLVWMDPAELVENPLNWRQHPPEQMSALAGSLSEVGWAGACLLNSRSNRLIDGHARLKLALDQGAGKIPVLVGSWTEEQERLILATLDPIADMATADPGKLAVLLAGCRESLPSPGEDGAPTQALSALLTGLASKYGIAESKEAPSAPTAFPEFGEDIETEFQCPRCSYAWSGKPK